MDRIAKLKQAETLLREVRGSLNRRSTECECCERKVYENWDEAQMYDRLAAAIKRCETVSEWLTRKGQDQA